MDQSKISVRYARALFSSGKEQGLLVQLYHDVRKIDALFRQSEELQLLLSNPVIRISKKSAIIQQIFRSHISDLALRFIIMVTENKREPRIPDICRNFIDMVRADQGIVPATVTTATPLSDSTVAIIRQNLESETRKTVELTEKINSSIIGGMILRIEDLQYDGSISGQLKKIKTALLEK